VFGVSIEQADWKGYDHYLAPTEAGRPYFAEFDAKYPAFTSGYGMRVKAHADAKVLATTTLPWPAPDPTKFASIHSNSPWAPTERPEIVWHAFGKGRVIYAASVIETLDTLGGTFVALLRGLVPEFTFEVDAPAAVEATLFHQPDRKRYQPGELPGATGWRSLARPGGTARYVACAAGVRPPSQASTII
jgi:hypothetical protein